jgi:hypothetical protein
MLLKKIFKPYILKRILLERLSEPLHLNLISIFIYLFGSYRLKIYFDLVLRQQHAYGLLFATEKAMKDGYKKLTIIEFGVANGAGLINISKICKILNRIYGLEYHIYGFDTGVGMPDPLDFRDHPELYKYGDFPMDQSNLKKVLPVNCKLVIGDVRSTVPEFISSDSLLESPIGFMCLDLDYYSSTRDALHILLSDPRKYLDPLPIYFDDVDEYSHNACCGELLAIKEFNEANVNRRIQRHDFLLQKRLFKNAVWIRHMFFAHILDSPGRNTIRRGDSVILTNPYFKN